MTTSPTIALVLLAIVATAIVAAWLVEIAQHRLTREELRAVTRQLLATQRERPGPRPLGHPAGTGRDQVEDWRAPFVDPLGDVPAENRREQP